MSSSRAVVAARRSVKIGVDFGTYGSGFMTKTDASSRANEFFTYPDTPFSGCAKNLSTILYKDGNPIDWGWSARKAFLALSAEERRRHKYVYLKNIKLAIQQTSGCKLPDGMAVVDVTADYLRFLCEFAKEEMKKLYAGGFYDDVAQWCLTVPANWDDAAKHTMRQAAVLAGMGKDEDALIIVYEPEAAALSAKSRLPQTLDGAALQCGEIFMVVDAGGGTVDVTMHRAVDRNGEVVLAETNYCRGAFAGSTYIDEKFRLYLKQEVGEQAYEEWLRDAPEESLQLDVDWEAVKCRFAGVDAADDEGLPYVMLPPGLLARMTADDKNALKCNQDGYEERVILLRETIQKFFDPVVEQVLQLVRDQLRAAGQRRCDKILLAGGFAESAYLVKRIGATFADQVDSIMVAPHPQQAVVEGAVLYGCNPDLISQRCSRLTYGMRVAYEWEEDPAGTKIWVPEEGGFYTNSGFWKFVSRGQAIQVDEAVEHMVHPLHQGQQFCDIELFATEELDAKYVPPPDAAAGRAAASTMQSVGATLQVVLPADMRDHAAHNILVRMHFGRTEITVTASDMQTNQQYATRVVFKHKKVPL